MKDHDHEVRPSITDPPIVDGLPTESKSVTPDVTQDPSAARLDEALQEKEEASLAEQDHAHKQNVEFVGLMKLELAMVRDELDLLSAEVEKAGGTIKTGTRAQLVFVRERWVAAIKYLDRAACGAKST